MSKDELDHCYICGHGPKEAEIWVQLRHISLCGVCIDLCNSIAKEGAVQLRARREAEVKEAPLPPANAIDPPGRRQCFLEWCRSLLTAAERTAEPCHRLPLRRKPRRALKKRR